jgi:predicted aminopeptidase
MIKKALLTGAGLLVLLLIWQRELVSYGWMQAKGQVAILLNVQPIEKVLADPAFPDSLKAKIRLIEEIKRFGVDSLGLTPSDNYTTFYDQQGKPILWVITATGRYAIQAYEWQFPILGTFPYKGFFDSTRAATEMLDLKKQGMDTHIGEVSAWSTLGYFKDPILSTMLSRSEGSLANLILHELTHGTLFVKNNLELNENLATFVGDEGAIRFLEYKYGKDSPQLRKYLYQKDYNSAYAKHMMRGAAQLDSLYKTFDDPKPSSRKDSLKQAYIERIAMLTDTLMGGQPTASPNTYKKRATQVNNAYFVGYQTYRSQQNSFKEQFEKEFGSNFTRYLAYLKSNYSTMAK